MKVRLKRLLALFLSLVMLVSTLPVTGIAADGPSEEAVSSLARLYDGDENRARSDLEALYASGLIDEDGGLVALDIRENGSKVELSSLAQRIAQGEAVGTVTVNGSETSPEQIVKIAQVEAALEIARLLDEEINVTDEHVENLEALLNGIADGSISLDDVLKSGSQTLTWVNAPLLGSGNSANVPESNTGTGNVTAENGSYNAPYISGSTYEAEHSFTLADPDNTVWYTDSVASGGDNVVTLYYRDTNGHLQEINDNNEIPIQETNDGKKYIFLFAGLSSTPSDTVSFEFTVASDLFTLQSRTIFDNDWVFDTETNSYRQREEWYEPGNMVSKTITWEPGESVSEKKTFEVFIEDADESDKWNGSQCVVLNAGNIKNATFKNGGTSFSYTVQYVVNDADAVRNDYPAVTHELQASDFTSSNSHLEQSYVDYGTVVTDKYSYNTLTDGLFPMSGRFTASIFTKDDADPYITMKGVKKDPSEGPLGYNVGIEVKLSNPDSAQYTLIGMNSYKEFREDYASYYYTIKSGYYKEEGADSLYNVVKDGKANLSIDIMGVELEKIVVTSYGIITRTQCVSVTAPAGTYYSGEVVPITVKLADYAIGTADTKLTVNGVECPMLNKVGTEAKIFTFGYTVKEKDAATLNVTALSGFKNAIGAEIPVEDGIQKNIGVDQGVSIVNDVKTGTIDWDSVLFGIDDAAFGKQTVTLLIPFATGADKTWIANETVAISSGQISLPLPGFPDATAKAYLKSAYFSVDGGKTRYPVYVVGESADALAVRFTAPVNVFSSLRKDMLYPYLDTTVGTTVNYLGKELKDANGFIYFETDEGSASATPVSDRSYSYYVKGSTVFEQSETKDRNGYNDANVITKDNGPNFYKDGDNYILLQGEDYSKQNDVELVANEALYNAAVNGIPANETGSLILGYMISDRKNFTFADSQYFTWSSSNTRIASVEMNKETGEGHVFLTGTAGDVTITLTVCNGSDENSYELTYSFTVLVTKAPFLNIPASSRERVGITGMDIDVMFASGVTAYNSAQGKDTTFNVKLYTVSDLNGTPTGDPSWTKDFTSTVDNTLSHITIPGSKLPNVGIYAVVINTSYAAGTVDDENISAGELSATAYLNIKPAPVQVTLNKLESYAADYNSLPAIGYTLTSATANVQVEYTIQKSGEAVGTRKSASGGTIPFTAEKPSGLKDAYTVTVYARNKADDPWSVDSLLITVYNGDMLELIVKDVVAGEVGGTTGGTGDNANGSTVALDNHDKLENYGIFGKNSYQLTFDDLNTLRTDLSLQKIISANYGSGVWGLLSDKLQWQSEDSSLVSVDYEQGGIYSDIRNYNYVSYGPATDFLLVGKGETDGVTVTATHAATGKTASVKVTARTLENQLYVFKFSPQTITTVTYTNGAGVERRLMTNDKGELAVYEPNGIASAVMAVSEKDGDTYVGTIYNRDLRSGERDIAALQLYPCNNLKLKLISTATLTFLKPDGNPYTGNVILRGGVYLGQDYCPDAAIRTEKNSTEQYLREDIELTADYNGSVNVFFDPTQFNAGSNYTFALGLKYIFEYRFEDSYQPGYVVIDVNDENTGAAVVNLKSIRGSKTAPQIIRQEYQQYLGGDTPTAYVRNVIDTTENIGISTNFSKAILYTDIALPGETVGTDDKGFSTYQGSEIVKFAFTTAAGKKLTGQTDLSSDNAQATQITKLSMLNSAVYFVFPFSSIPMMRSTYVMTNENLTADGITDEGQNPTPTVRVKAVFTRGALTVKTLNMPFNVTNVSHQPDLTGSKDGAKEVGLEVRENLRKTTDIGAIFRSINVNDMIKKGFVFLGNLNGVGGDNPVDLIILPTQDPAVFRVIAIIGSKKKQDEKDEGVSVNFNTDDLAEDAKKLEEEVEKMGKDDDDDDDSNGEGKLTFNFYGTVILEVRAGVEDGKWDIAFRGGNVGTNVEGKYEWSQNFLCGPVPVFVSFEVGFTADLEVAFGNKDAVRAMMLDAALGVSVEAFAGLGFDLSLIALQLGIYGKIGADVNFLLLTPNDSSVKNGTKLTIAGEIGLKFRVKILCITYSKKLASTGFNWTKKWNDYDVIQNYWTDQGFAQLFGVTQSGRVYSMYLMADGSTMVAIEGEAELESRDYLELAERRWDGGGNSGWYQNTFSNIQTNAYPYSNPVFTDDGGMFLYISDNNNTNEVESVVSYAVKNDSGYADQGRIDTSEGNILSDHDVVASGTGSNAFAAWVKQTELPKMDDDAAVNNDDLGMMLNATEIYAGNYNGTTWTTTRLTNNNKADMAPTVASSGNRAIVAWRSLSAASMSAGSDLTSMFNVENYINYRIYNGTKWTDAKILYNGSAGTVNAIDSAMLSDGTALVTYTVRTGEDVASTETFYTVIGTDGNVITTGRLTNDNYTDANAQVTAVNEDDGYFVLGWYSEHDAGEGMTSEYDDNGNAAQKAVVAHDIRLARINANGSLDISFPESIGGNSSSNITSDFRFSSPSNNTDLKNVSIVWSQRFASDSEEEAGKYELKAVRFYKAGVRTGLTAPISIASTDRNYTIDKFDAYTDSSGSIHAIIIGSDYSTIEGIDVYDRIDLSTAAGNTITSNSDSPNTLEILDGEAISSMKIATGNFRESAVEVIANVNISEVIPGFTAPLQFVVTNTGTDVLDELEVEINYSQTKTFTGLDLLPNQSAVLIIPYDLPEGRQNNLNYTISKRVSEWYTDQLAYGSLDLNRPDVGIRSMKLLQEHDGIRDIQIMLYNGSGIPLADNWKSVRVALYRDPLCKDSIGEPIWVDQSDYAKIDAGTYTVVKSVDVTQLYNGDEIPDSGLTVYARAWVDDTDEPNLYNNVSFLSFNGLLTKNNGEKLSIDTVLETNPEDENIYSVYADIRNNSMQTLDAGILKAVLYDASGNVIAEKPFNEGSLSLTKEQRTEMLVVFTTDEVAGKTAADVVVYSDAIGKEKAAAGKPEARVLSYNGQVQELVSAGEGFGGTIKYALGSDATNAPSDSLYTTSIPTATNIGTYYVWYKVFGDNKHEDSEAFCITVSIMDEIPTPAQEPAGTGTPTPAQEPTGTLLPKNLKTDVENSDDAPEVKFEITLEQARELLTEEELETLENGADILIYLVVDALGEDEIPADDRLKLEAYLKEKGENKGMFLDISLWKKVGTDTEEQIHESKKAIEIRIEVPKELRDVPKGYTRTYKILRVHDGKVDVVGEGKDTTITVLSDKFSTYLITYTDTANAVIPQTADTLAIPASLVLLAGFALLAAFAPDRKKRIKNVG